MHITKKAIIPIHYMLLTAIIIIALVVVSPFIFKFISQSLSVFTKTPVTMVQYATPSGYNILREDWDSGSIVKSSTASVYGYTLKTSITDYSCQNEVKFSCYTNSCSGTAYSTDQYGCTLYKYFQSQKWIAGYSFTGIDFPTSRAFTQTGSNIKCTCTTGCSVLECKNGSQKASGVYPGSFKVFADVTTYCGGAYNVRTESVCSRACWVKQNLTKDGAVLYNSPTYEKVTNKAIQNGIMDFQLGYSSVYDPTLQTCKWVSNTFRFVIPDNAFNFTVKVPEGEVEEGTNINVEIEINNRWKTAEGDLQVYFEVPTVLSTPSTETNKKFVSVPLGKSIHTYTIPTGRVTDVLKVKPSLTLLVKGSDFSGINAVCYGATSSSVVNAASCQYIQIGVVTDDVTEITIIPRTTIIEIEKVIDCQTSADCKIPQGCTGVASQCLANKTCQYNGACYYKPETQSQSIWSRM